MLNLERLGNFTAELSANLVRSIVLPGGLLGRLTRPVPGGKVETKQDVESMARPTQVAGPLALVGATAVPDEVVVSLVHFCGGRSARLGILGVGETNPEALGEKVERLFTRFGMRSVEKLAVASHDEANRPELAEQLAEFDVVAVSAREVEGALAILSGSACAAALHQIIAAGRPVLGFGVGSDLLAERVVLHDGSATAGLGLAPGLVISAHNEKKPVLSQLVQAVGSQDAAQLLGVSLDDSAALLIREAEARVVGEGNVTFVDGRETTALETAGAGAPICGLKVHVLVSGFSLSLKNRKPIAPAREAVQATP